MCSTSLDTDISHAVQLMHHFKLYVGDSSSNYVVKGLSVTSEEIVKISSACVTCSVSCSRFRKLAPAVYTVSRTKLRLYLPVGKLANYRISY